jgi:hypothetical protein
MKSNLVNKSKRRCLDQNNFVSNIKIPTDGGGQLTKNFMGSKISLATQTKVVNFGATFTKQTP